MSELRDNIDRFNLLVLTIFQKLYDSFPTPVNMEPTGIGVSAAPSDASEQGVWDSMAEARHALTWLKEEGFLRYETQDLQGNFYEVRLSQKGLAMLGSALTPSEVKEPLITRVRRTLASGAEKAGTEAVKCLMSEVLKLSARYGMSALGGP
jgi:hypothetical protein